MIPSRKCEHSVNIVPVPIFTHTKFYRDWLNCFWDQVCRKGQTIKEAVRFANRTIKASDDDFKTTQRQRRMPVKCLGGDNTLLWVKH